jgi:hypothetical protein
VRDDLQATCMQCRACVPLHLTRAAAVRSAKFKQVMSADPHY